MTQNPDDDRLRNKNYIATHARLIAVGVELLAKGVTLSMAALSRAANIDRSALYYHFENSQAMMQEIGMTKSISLEQAIADAWQELVEYDDRTSPESYPDMALIARDEFADFMRAASRHRTTTQGDGL